MSQWHQVSPSVLEEFFTICSELLGPPYYLVTATAPGYKSKTTGIWLDKASTNVDFVLNPNVNGRGIPLHVNADGALIEHPSA
ncbi:hypothetical protein L3X38_041662 [Prunus dulcis]|uniref:Uncharacterized protein n=1 Tax=Prunus dulcis TaxID=3755 RepID=A0AAD4YKV2_PRUDU|nr:hypothetical protein L3X38_041662 [Prunus dulcis]